MTNPAAGYNENVIVRSPPAKTDERVHNIRSTVTESVTTPDDTDQNPPNPQECYSDTEPPTATEQPPNALETAAGDEREALTASESPNPDSQPASFTAIILKDSLTATIDSIQIKIPLTAELIDKHRYHNQQPIEVIPCRYSPKLDSNDITYNDLTGEVLRRKQSITEVVENGMGAVYKKERYTLGNQHGDRLSIGFSSKLLGTNYLQGISLTTIKQIYDELTTHNVIQITYDNFLKATVEYADTKIDANTNEIENIFSSIKANLRTELADRGRIYHAKTYTHKSNNRNIVHAISIGERKNLSNQFVKFYNKHYELRTKSSIFAEKHLRGQDTSNLLRIEVTSYQQHIRKAYTTFDGTLKSLLQVTANDGVRMIYNLLTTTIFQSTQQPSKPILVVADKDKDMASIISGMVIPMLELSRTEQQTLDHVLKYYPAGINKTYDIRRLVPRIYEYQLQLLDCNQKVIANE